MSRDPSWLNFFLHSPKGIHERGERTVDGEIWLPVRDIKKIKPSGGGGLSIEMCSSGYFADEHYVPPAHAEYVRAQITPSKKPRVN